MPLVQAKCPNCGANLEIDNSKDDAICPYCNSAYIVEKAINNHYTTNNIQANVVNVYGGGEADFVIRAGVLYKYSGAAIDVVIPNNVIAIGDSAFRDCMGLLSVTIPDSVTAIGKNSFRGCANLRSVELHNGIASIGDSAFYDCTSLVSISIPDSVISIGKHAFAGCTSLLSLKIGEVVSEIGANAFCNCASLTEVLIPVSVTAIGQYAFLNCKNLTSITIPGIDLKEVFCGCPIKRLAFHPGTSTVDWEKVSISSTETVVLPDSVDAILNWGHISGVKEVIASPSVLENNENAIEYMKRPQKNGCYIATAVYGSYDCPEVWTLRRFRDNELAKTWHGRAFIHAYYEISPTLVKWFGRTVWFKNMFKPTIDRMVKELNDNGVESTPYIDQVW